jgi:alpha-glucosidase
MHEVMRFWFDRGVDGFRIDVLWHMIKAADFPDNPPNPAIGPPWARCTACSSSTRPTSPKIHAIAARCAPSPTSYGTARGARRARADRRDLSAGRSSDGLLRRERAGVHLPFNFQLIDAPWQARRLRP